MHGLTCVRQFAFVAGKPLSSRHRRNFNLGNIPPGTEKYRSAFFFPPFFVASPFFFHALSVINAPETSLFTASFAIINLPLDSNRQFARLNATLRSFAVHVPYVRRLYVTRMRQKSPCLFSVGEGFAGETAAFARL